MTIHVRVEGAEELNRALRAIPGKAKEAAAKELADIILDLAGEAQRRAPIDTGDLRGSAYAEMDGLSGAVGFAVPYAIVQHEGVEFNHPRGGEAKFLENPLKEKSQMYIKAIGDAIKGAIE